MWQAVIAAVAAVALLATCGMFSWHLVQDELAGRNAQADIAEPSTPPLRDLSSRQVDPEPLTVDEVFPTDEIVINPDEEPYRVLGTQDSEDCTVAATDELADLLDGLGCTQVVRATLRSPTDAYLITAGIFNLESEQEAAAAYEAIHPLIEDQTGRFRGLVAGPDTEQIMISQTHLGWDYRGHFLLYAVIARSDGGEFSLADDRHADLIIWDMVEVHLRSGVLDLRAAPDASATAATDSDTDGDGDGDEPDDEGA